MSELTKTDEQGTAWYPTSIDRLERVLIKVVCSGHGYEHSYALRKNIAYNLQYIQFQDRILQDIKLSSVLTTQTIKTIKTIVLVGCGVIESILHFLHIKNGTHSTTEWKEKYKFKGNQKKMDGVFVRVDTVIFNKLENEELKHMTFDAMIKCAKARSIFGQNPNMYDKLELLRTLRNKVHLQVINNPTDTDWNSFTLSHLSDICIVLHAIFTSSLFTPSETEAGYFEYLRRNISV